MLRLVRLKCRVHCYATEDLEKVKKSVENILNGVKFSVKETKMEGHYGDAIYALEYEVLNESEVASVFKKILSHLGVGVLGVEQKSPETGKFHIRLDKQKAFKGEIVAEDVDPVKMEFSYEGDWREVFRWVEST
ncbi:MAG: RNA-binding domain-containing protein [Candidatus Caldarchaeum sp.]